MNKIFLDLETTGLNVNKGDRIIEICCININNSNIFHHYLNTEKKISEEAFLIHGINNEFLKNKPYFKEICYDFLNYIRNSILIIHNARFDISFLNYHLNNINLKNINNYCYKIIDTLKISRKIYKNKKNSLEYLCKRFKIDYSKRIKHSALIDVFLLREVYLKLKLILNKFKFLKKKKFDKILRTKKNNIIKKANLKEIKLNNFFFKNYLFFK
ncbi:MAG: exonuclease domain-containing protein [Candidatus Nasuia deltocephalinicola]